MYHLALSAATLGESGPITTSSGFSNLGIVAFIFGAILLLVGLLGGQSKISAFEMSGRATLGVRIVAGILGCALIGVGVFLYIRPATPQQAVSETTPSHLSVIPPADKPAVDKPTVDKPANKFVDDPEALGTWKSVDFVSSIEDFVPGQRRFSGELFLKELVILPNGRTKGPWTWTKGSLYHPGDHTLSHYEIRQIGGATYLFFEWESGDYILRQQKPSYYVLTH